MIETEPDMPRPKAEFVGSFVYLQVRCIGAFLEKTHWGYQNVREDTRDEKNDIGNQQP